ncbi:prepilin peptidase [Mycobacterium deserti]|uniref:A24 family peptidase n=1 Tax=Mycobacterium deserti TaxID=2978347 RepID=A0ABT2MBP1_9MYCO|nr:A24 family peptidase [Mycobacterium deserti]MCT7659683.1 A24 family peptidase [Mycobacterium deserti]
MGVGIACGCALAWLTALSVFDIRQRRLPNWLTVPGAVVVVLWAVTAGRGEPALLGGAALFAGYLLVHLFAPAAMGAGDVKLAAGVGAMTGAFGVDIWALAALGAPLLTATLGLVRRSESTVPHGPSMCLATAGATALAVV